MTTGSKALLAFVGIWVVLGAAGWYAGRANEQRDREHPRVWVTSEKTGQGYDVLEVRDAGGRFIGFDLENEPVRFADCTPGTSEDSPADCVDTKGARWQLHR